MWYRILFLLQPIDFQWNLAEREGFEPSVRLHVRLISSQVHSTTLPPLRSAEAAIVAVIFGPPTKNEDFDEISEIRSAEANG